VVHDEPRQAGLVGFLESASSRRRAVRSAPEPVKHRSLWLDTAPARDWPRAVPARRYDVAVVGGGITGITTALLLAREGLSVAVIEARRIGAGTTGHTTGKVTSQHRLTYADLARSHGTEGARVYAAASEAGKERIAALVGEGIECQFRRRPAFVYATSADERQAIEREAETAAELGLPATVTEEAPVPFAVEAAVRFDAQAELHPQRYLLGLAERLERAGGELFERTRVLGVSDGSPCRVETDSAEVLADRVVIATLLPILDRGLFFARAFPNRSYCIAARIDGDPVEAMLISAGSPTRSIRSHPETGEELLLIGGEGHHTGSGEARPQRYEQLERFARAHWRVRSIEYGWSAQDYSSADQVPYVGPIHPGADRIQVATGFRKWGMTSGTVAATLIADALTDRENEWAGFFSSTRLGPLGSLPKLVLENGRAGIAFVGERVIRRGTRPIGDLAPGEGGIVAVDGGKVAGYRDEDGDLHAVSARCTHLGCQVRWNAADRSWDCPCHGSRFGVDGDVLEGPAVRPLAGREMGAD
jgi:glycine/D-amino acid oxidase-like deaminating enzyme/nitrite reductase/ring-hydroxylating ferredoxin subunit